MQLPSPEPAPAVASPDEVMKLIMENMRLQKTFYGFQQENEGLQAEVDECQAKLKELQSRPIVQAEVEAEPPAVQAVQALEPEPQMEDPKTEGWVIFKGAALIVRQGSGQEHRPSTTWEYAKVPLMRRDGGIPNLAGQEAGDLIPGTRVDVTGMEMVRYAKHKRSPFTFKKPEIIENIKKGADEAAIGKSPFPSSFYTQKIQGHEGGLPIDVGSAFECRMTEVNLKRLSPTAVGLCDGFIWDRQAAKEDRDQPTPDEFIMAVDDHFPQFNGDGQIVEWQKIHQVEDRDVYIRPGVSLQILADKIWEYHVNRGKRGRGDQMMSIVVENEADRAYLAQIQPESPGLI